MNNEILMRFLITAGPTREYIDPVRFLSNPSTGKMGYALAQEACDAGHDVCLISGPVNIIPSEKIETIQVMTALEMQKIVIQKFQETDILIMTAAVSDFRPENTATQKIKKDGEDMILRMIPNPDILKSLIPLKKHQKIMGFAAETENLMRNAQDKLERKKLDWIVVNDVSNKSIGFGSDDNQVTIITPQENIELKKMSKQQVAKNLINFIVS